ncbi:MAG: AraC family transcriptional regulator [Gammaproteobacteria bacterium]|nr:AraC family transcriptional regulator [Gammaproteobacteria bacterium]
MIKPSTATDYQRRMNQVIQYLFDHLDEDIRIDDLAEVAHLSPYHWHRIYTAMQGETVANTIKRLRLNRAANQLANTDLPIKSIAEQAKYSSVEGFSRSFKSAYLQSPAAYRDTGSHSDYKSAIDVQDASRFDVKIEPLDVSHCAAVSHTGSYMHIDQAMGQLMGGLAAQQLLSDAPRMLAVFYDDPELTPAEQLRSAALSPLDTSSNVTAPIEHITLYQGPYAKLLYTGPYADMKDAYQWLYGTWLPDSGFTAADAPAIEEYLNNPQEVPATELQTLMCLPLNLKD